MLYYTLSNILLIEKNFIDNNSSFIDNSNNVIPTLTDDTINILYTIEYKFKERKQYKSKYNSPKPISFSDIRLNLNKLSNKSYSTYFKQIISLLHILNKNESTDIFNDIFTHISSNQFMVKPYSKLSSSLIEIFPEYSTIFYDNNNSFLQNIADTSFNYNNSDDFHANKIKDNLKANAVFYTNNFIIINNYDSIIANILKLQNIINDIIDNSDDHTVIYYKNKLEIISDIIFLYNKHSIHVIYYLPSYNNIFNNINHVISKKPNKHISRKVIFNHMDILDLYKNIKNINN
jgi:hypothetical protein